MVAVAPAESHVVVVTVPGVAPTTTVPLIVPFEIGTVDVYGVAPAVSSVVVYTGVHIDGLLEPAASVKQNSGL